MFKFVKPVSKQEFVTSTNTSAVSVSAPVTILDPSFNKVTSSFEIRCSDKKTRRCLITNFSDYNEAKGTSKMANTLFNKLQHAYLNNTKVQFIAMGVFEFANKADLWFYNLKDAA